MSKTGDFFTKLSAFRGESRILQGKKRLNKGIQSSGSFHQYYKAQVELLQNHNKLIQETNASPWIQDSFQGKSKFDTFSNGFQESKSRPDFKPLEFDSFFGFAPNRQNDSFPKEILKDFGARGAALAAYLAGAGRTVSYNEIASFEGKEGLLNREVSRSASTSSNPPGREGDIAKRDGHINDIINQVSADFGIDPRLTRAIIQVESNFDPEAVSHAGAMGMMQLMPDTARYLGVHNPFDPRENIQGGVRYLSELLENYDNLEEALAAYNAGPGNVSKYGGIPPFEETQNYISRVVNEFNSLRKNA